MSDVEVLDQAPASVEEAEELTGQIRQALEFVWELVVEAWERRAWVALGYNSWDEYCDAEFNSSRLKLPRAERRIQVKSLSDAGLSVRQIASATGVTHPTVLNDLKEEGGKNLPPEDGSGVADDASGDTDEDNTDGADDDKLDMSWVDDLPGTLRTKKDVRAVRAQLAEHVRQLDQYLVGFDDLEACVFCGNTLPEHLQIHPEHREE